MVNKLYRLITYFGVIGFISIVIYLHKVQDNYDPSHQLMSELALGDNGDLMLYAFIMFSIAIAGAIGILASSAASFSIILTMSVALISLLGAGIFKLGEFTSIHISLVAIAFISIGLAMYAVPRYVSSFKTRICQLMSWGLCVITVLFVSFGGLLIPIGIAQRLSALCILTWLIWLATASTKRT